MLLRTGGVEYHNRTSAPWLSTEIFVTGCYRNCEGCFNEQLKSFEGRHVDVDEIIKDLIENVPYKKVTFSGGEPFIQAKELGYIAEHLQKEGFTIVCYTGYTFGELGELSKRNLDIECLVDNIDILVDGPFRKDLLTPIDEDFKFVGSSNQRVINIKETIRQQEYILWTDEDTKRIKEDEDGRYVDRYTQFNNL